MTNTTDWRHEAACIGVNPETFFPHVGHPGVTTADARAICKRCPVVAECLQFALDTDSNYGIYGGRTPEQRRRIRARKPAQPGTARYRRYDPVKATEAANGQMRQREQLSPSEVDAAVRILHAQGLTDGQIAYRSGISVRTVVRSRARQHLPAVPHPHNNHHRSNA